MNSAAAVEALYRLNTGVIGTRDSRHERPHKPVLLLAVFDAVASGKARPDRVPWSQWLRDRLPFAETRNDHPTNGLALCKNHRWALDQRLIAPDSNAVWRVSRYIEPRRSRGEEELARLAGQPVLPPAERAFAPDRAGLEWRFTRMLN